MAMQNGNNPVILREQRDCCRMLEVAEKIDISASFKLLTLLNRHGG